MSSVDLHAKSVVHAYFAVSCALCAGMMISKLVYNTQCGSWFESAGVTIAVAILDIVAAIGNAWSLVRATENRRADKV